MTFFLQEVQCVHLKIPHLKPYALDVSDFFSPVFFHRPFSLHFTHETHRQTPTTKMFSLTSTVASAKLTSKVRPHPFAPAPRTRFRSRDLERERFPKRRKKRENQWIFSFFWRRTFSRHRQKGGLRGKSLVGRGGRRARGCIFYPVATKTRIHRARNCSRDSMRPSTRGWRHRVFVVVSFFRKNDERSPRGRRILKFHLKGREAVSYLKSIFRCPSSSSSSCGFFQSNRTRADRGASLFPSPWSHEQVNFKTSRTAAKARAGFSVNAAAVRPRVSLFFISSSIGLFWIEFTKKLF